MSSMLITKEDFERMRSAMDKDGDGRVERGEFEEAYRLVYSGAEKDFKTTFDIVWSKIDADGDGNLTVDELAAFYGFSSENSTGEMTDEQILSALSLAAELDAKRGAASAPVEKAKVKKLSRDLTIKTIQLDKKCVIGDKTNPGESAKGAELSEKSIANMVSLMELLSGAQASDLKSEKEDKDTVHKLLQEKELLVRMEDQNGEMPLHKLARFVMPEEKVETFKMVYHALLKKMRDEAKDCKRPLAADVNKQDAKGKTPMFQAIEMKNTLMIEMLNELDRDKPDSLIVTGVGWSVLHQAVQTNDFAVVKEVVKGLQKDGGRLRVLINLRDKTGRQPLHIAAYRCSEEIITFLMDHGANGEATDSGGLAPPKLAEKAGRRVSKEIIDEHVRRSSKEGCGGRGSRRASKEMLDALEPEHLRRPSKEKMGAPSPAPA